MEPFFAGKTLPPDPASLRELPDALEFEGEKIQALKVRLGELTDLNDILSLKPELGRKALLVRVVNSPDDRGCAWAHVPTGGLSSM